MTVIFTLFKNNKTTKQARLRGSWTFHYYFTIDHKRIWHWPFYDTHGYGRRNLPLKIPLSIASVTRFFSEPAPPILKPAQFASPTNSKILNSKTSPIFHQNSPKFWKFFGKNRKNVHPAQPAPSPSKILPAPQTLKTARGAGNSPIWQHC